MVVISYLQASGSSQIFGAACSLDIAGPGRSDERLARSAAFSRSCTLTACRAGLSYGLVLEGDCGSTAATLSATIRAPRNAVETTAAYRRLGSFGKRRRPRYGPVCRCCLDCNATPSRDRD